MTTTSIAPVEIQALQRDIEKLEQSKSDMMEALKAASSAGDFAEVVRLGGAIKDADTEIDKLSNRLARATGEATVNVKMRIAEELKSLVQNALAPVQNEINAKVRELWAAQPNTKLSKIELGFDFEHPAATPPISLVGGFRQVSGDSKSGPITRTRAKWLDTVDGQELTTRGIIERYGAKYNQDKAYRDMTPEERGSFRDRIVAGEQLTRVDSSPDGVSGDSGEDGTNAEE